MNIDAKMINETEMEVTFAGKTLAFRAWKASEGWVADKVFAAPVTRNGKDWPVSALIRNDGTTAVYYPSGLTLNHGNTVRITGFWVDSKNQSKHNKV